LLLWDDHADCVDCLSKLLTASAKREQLVSDKQYIRVLFVDDSPTVRASFKRLMMRHGYEVDTAASAAEAMEKAKQHPYDIAIADYSRDRKVTTCAALRKHLTADIIIAIITGSYREEVIRDSLDAGPWSARSRPKPAHCFWHALPQ
jgi:CheY-like chemotaxis protein